VVIAEDVEVPVVLEEPMSLSNELREPSRVAVEEDATEGLGAVAPAIGRIGQDEVGR
jgi:hypothetical protein